MIQAASQCTFRLIESQVHVWCVDPKQVAPQLLQSLPAFLSPEETAKAQRFIKPAHQQRSIETRGLLRILLSRYLNCHPAEINLSQNGFGKPELAEQEMQFNVSHSGDWIVYAFTKNHPIGIDVEESVLRDNFVKLTEHFATPSEIHAIESADNLEIQTQRFYRLWTAKEAVVKALGKGFYADTRKFTIACLEDQPLTVSSTDINNIHWQLTAFTPAHGYAGCVASYISSTIQYYCIDGTWTASSTPLH